MSALPPNLPLFPLPNAVLFPGVPLPLHVFEPRYRAMVEDVSKGDERLIGIVLLRGEWRKDYYGNPTIFPIGCAGRMVSVERLPDGRFDILLQGLREFQVESEDQSLAYRRATVKWRPASLNGLDSGLREEIRQLARQFLGDGQAPLARTLLDDASLSDELLVNLLCYALNLSPLEKQALLEAEPLHARASRLCEVVRFALQAGAASGSEEEWRH